MTQAFYDQHEMAKRLSLIPKEKPLWRPAVQLTMEQYQQIVTQFDSADVDHNGAITRSEFRQTMSGLAPAPPAAPTPAAAGSTALPPEICSYTDILADLLFDTIDRMPSDGTISFPEFLVYMAVNLIGTEEERLFMAFSMIDRDNDGYVLPFFCCASLLFFTVLASIKILSLFRHCLIDDLPSLDGSFF
jgi:Ca2+-binding EF-hand superfamily protein